MRVWDPSRSRKEILCVTVDLPSRVLRLVLRFELFYASVFLDWEVAEMGHSATVEVQSSTRRPVRSDARPLRERQVTNCRRVIQAPVRLHSIPPTH